jgi:hypothetical protein
MESVREGKMSPMTDDAGTSAPGSGEEGVVVAGREAHRLENGDDQPAAAHDEPADADPDEEGSGVVVAGSEAHEREQ